MPKFVTTHVVTPDRVAELLTPRTDLLVERIDHGDPTGIVRAGWDGHLHRRVRALHPLPTLVTVPRRTSQGRTSEPTGRPRRQAGRELEVTQKFDYRLAIPVWRPCSPRRCGACCAPAATAPAPPVVAAAGPLRRRGRGRLSLLCVFAVLAGYLGTLLTQTNTYFKQDFGVSDGQVGVMLAAVRVGALLALVIVALADRRGRRRVLLWSAVAGCVVTATGALAPDLAVLGREPDRRPGLLGPPSRWSSPSWRWRRCRPGPGPSRCRC